VTSPTLVDHLIATAWTFGTMGALYGLLWWYASYVYKKAHEPKDKDGKPKKQTAAQKYGLE
jgi:hypothetical protein